MRDALGAVYRRKYTLPGLWWEAAVKGQCKALRRNFLADAADILCGVPCTQASRPLMRELRGSVYEPLQRAAHTLERLERGRGEAREDEAEWEAVWGALLRPRERVNDFAP